MAKGGRGRGRHSGGQQRGGGTATAVRGAGPGTRAPANMADAARSGGAEVQPWGLADAMNAIAARAGLSNPMPRSALDQVPFGPNWALPPQPLDPARPDTGRPEPRVFEYPVAFNIPGNGNRPIPWDTLYAASTNVDIVRRCIEIRKRHLRGMEWGFSVTEEAIAEALLGDPASGRMDVETKLREQYLPEIRRATEFWRKPWKANGLSFGQWLNGWMDQHLVLDGVAVYPRTTYGGDVTDLEIIDASTIKLLLDNRGARPEHPFPAFQQELYGFPRGEFTVSVGEDGMMHGGYAADQLYYHRENFRPQTPYGFSAVEQCLISARLYLKRQGWMLAEYDDGSTPLMWLVPAPTAEMWSQMDANQRRRWEQSLNDEMAGNQGGRHRVKVTPPGFQPIAMPSVDERYKPEYDLFLIKMAAGFFNVTVAELGLTEPKGLGSSGYHEGQEAVEGRVGQRPDTVMVAESINDLSYDFLRLPREIEFKFIDPQADDEKTKAEVAGMRRARGTITLNDERREIGMAPLPFKEADMPMLIAGDKATPLEGLAKVLELAQQAQQASLEASNAQMEADGEAADLEAEELEGAAAEKALEMASYRRWARKRGGRAGRMFICKTLAPSDWPGEQVPADVDFEHWEWVPDDAEIVKAFGGNDNWRTLARDHRGRWMPRGRMRVDPLGPATPGKEVLSGLQREAAARRGAGSSGRRDWPQRQLSGDEESTPAGRRYAAAVAAYDAVRGESYGPDTPREQRNDRARRLQSAQDEVRAALDELERGGEQSTEFHSTSVDTPTTMQGMTSPIVARQQPQAFPRSPRNAKPKTEHRVTLPDGTVATRSSQHDYTHAVVTTRDNRAYARHLEAEAQRDVERGFVERAGWREQVAQLNAGPAVTYGAPAFSASLADARTAARKHATPYQTTRVVSVDTPDSPVTVREEGRQNNPGFALPGTPPDEGPRDKAERLAREREAADPMGEAARAVVAAERAERERTGLDAVDAGPAKVGGREGYVSEGDRAARENRAQAAAPRRFAPAAPATPEPAKPAKPAKPVKRSYTVTLPDGSTQTRRTERDYTHAVVLTKDNHALAALFEERAATAASRGRQNDADRAAAAAAEYRSLPRYEYSLVSMSASAAGAAKRAAELEKRGPWFRAEVREATADAPAQSPAAVTPEAGNVAAREFPASVDAAPSADGVRAVHAELTAANGGNPVSLLDLRAKLGGTREQQDEVLRELAGSPDVVFWPEENQKTLTAADRAAAVHIGGEDKHLLHIDAPREAAPTETSEQAAERIAADTVRRMEEKRRASLMLDHPVFEPGGDTSENIADYIRQRGAQYGGSLDSNQIGLSGISGAKLDVAVASGRVVEIPRKHAFGRTTYRAATPEEVAAHDARAASSNTPARSLILPDGLDDKQRERYAVMGERADAAHPQIFADSRATLERDAQNARGALADPKIEGREREMWQARLDNVEVMLAAPRGDAAVQATKPARELVEAAEAKGMVVLIQHNSASDGAPFFTVQAFDPATKSGFTATFHTFKGKNGSYGLQRADTIKGGRRTKATSVKALREHMDTISAPKVDPDR